MVDSCGSDLLANELLPSLLGDKSFDIIDIDLDDPVYQLPDTDNNPIFDNITKLTNEDLTTGEIDGTGTFDIIMKSLRKHLMVEFEKNRITGAEYSRTYIELTQAGLSSAVQYLLSRDSSYWQAVVAQQQAKRAEIEFVIAKVSLATTKVTHQTAVLQALTVETDYALSKAKLATEDAGFCKLKAETATIEYTAANMLPQQLTLLKEQTEVQRAQTLNTRTDGATVAGAVGKQKDLYTQQIKSYELDAKNKVAKMLSDAWTVQKTIDEGLVPPTIFTNSSVDAVLTQLKNDTGL